jgi:hypothetical protein
MAYMLIKLFEILRRELDSLIIFDANVNAVVSVGKLSKFMNTMANS